MNYLEFVASRAKRMGSLAADLHHAATGMVGEAIELRAAVNRENFCEELGDFGFYETHYKLAWTWHGAEAPQPIFDEVGPSVGYAFDALIDASGQLLDLTKKLWVYNKPPEGVLAKIAAAHGSIHTSLAVLHEAFGYTVTQRNRDNQEKLELRYPTGYSDAAAQQRADKPAGE